MIENNNGPDPVPYIGPDRGVPMIGKATPKPPHGAKAPHEHKPGHVTDDGNGRQYCSACGQYLTVNQVEALVPGFFQNIMRIDTGLKEDERIIRKYNDDDEPTAIVDELINRRRDVYGDPNTEFPKVAQVWSGILGHEVNAVDVPLMLIGYKLVRAARQPDYSDNSDDVEGYLAIFRELVGEDMVSARSVEEYVKLKHERQRGR